MFRRDILFGLNWLHMGQLKDGSWYGPAYFLNHLHDFDSTLRKLVPPDIIFNIAKRYTCYGCGKPKQRVLTLVKLDAGRLFDKYIGESEKNFRKAISLAESMAPVVLWIDEIEKAMSGGGGDNDGGLSRRLFGTFLTWLQEKRQEVFVVATANDLSQLPPELLRKGRFDEVFFVDLPDGKERQTIFEIHLKLRRQDPENFDLAQLVEAADGYSGAEIEQAVIAALYRGASPETASRHRAPAQGNQ